MARKRLSMRKLKEVLRLRFGKKLGYHRIARSCGISPSTARDYAERATAAGLGWPLPDHLGERQLRERLFPPGIGPPPEPRRALPDMAEIRRELSSRSVTLQLLWEEYRGIHPDGYAYSRFCELYRAWAKKLDLCLRQHHRAGEKVFVDYAGQTIEVSDPATGETCRAHLFVAVLGASNYTYAEATESEQLSDWIRAHVNAFGYFGGVPAITVPDNTKTAITRPCRYEPDVNPTYQDLAEHYGTAVISARPGKPRDKAKVEAGVLVAERWILAALRHRQFFSLTELNRAIRELLVKLNARPFKKLPGCRAELFSKLDAPALQPLPAQRYEFAEWLDAGVNIDYHIHINADQHYYSVPHSLVGQRVQVRLTASAVEVLFRGRRVAAHARSRQRGGFTTLDEHRPKSHLRYLQWTPGRIIQWAGRTGTNCAEVVRHILESKPHPEQGYRSCLGLIRLAKAYGQERMEAACGRALALDLCSYRNISSMLKNGLESEPPPGARKSRPRNNAPAHVRGARYYR